MTQQIQVTAAGNYSVQTGDGTCLSVSSDPVTITSTGLACTGTLPPPPPAITNATRCGTGSVVLKAGGASTGQVYRWFSNNTSTSILFTGASFTTPSLTTTTSYFASIYDPTSTLESSRVTATATINNLPRPVLNLTGNQSTCVGTGLLLSAPVGYAQYLWSKAAV